MFNRFQYLQRLRAGVVLLAFGLLVGCSSAQVDPFESTNRSIDSVNNTIDRATLKPLATGYVKVTPGPVRQGIGNFFANLADPLTAVNQLLQGKPGKATSDLTRFIINSSVGVGGLIDVATPMGIEKHNEDFGQTLGVWGVPSGAYLQLPFMGPSTARDFIAGFVGGAMLPVTLIEHVPTRNSVLALALVDQRASLFPAEKLITGDRYLFIRDAYLQRREFQVKDGNVELEDDEFF